LAREEGKKTESTSSKEERKGQKIFGDVSTRRERKKSRTPKRLNAGKDGRPKAQSLSSQKKNNPSPESRKKLPLTRKRTENRGLHPRKKRLIL